MEVALKVTRDKNFKLVDYMAFDSKKENSTEGTPGKGEQIGSLSQNQEMLKVSGGVIMKTFAPERRNDNNFDAKKSVQ